MDASGVASIPLILKQIRRYNLSNDEDLAELIENLSGGTDTATSLAEIPKPYGGPTVLRPARPMRTAPGSAAPGRTRQLLIDAVRTTWFSESRRLVYRLPRLNVRCVLRSGANDGGSQQLHRSDSVIRSALSHNEKLILLGATGAGKTMFAREVLEQSLARADSDESQPIPLLLNLKSWAVQPGPVVDWVRLLTHTMYGAPVSAIGRWLEDGLFTLILDGLDEVGAEAMPKCVYALNEFMEQYAWCPVLISSRTSDYLSAGWPLQASQLIEIQPVSREDVVQYSATHLPEEVAQKVIAVMEENTAMVHTPLALAYVVETYRRLPDAERAVRTTLSGLADVYVSAALREDTVPTEAKRKRRWLQWIVRSMKRESEAVFYLENLSESTLLPQPAVAVSADLLAPERAFYSSSRALECTALERR
jgi:hypothetical protein